MKLKCCCASYNVWEPKEFFFISAAKHVHFKIKKLKSVYFYLFAFMVYSHVRENKFPLTKLLQETNAQDTKLVYLSVWIKYCGRRNLLLYLWRMETSRIVTGHANMNEMICILLCGLITICPVYIRFPFESVISARMKYYYFIL